MEKLNKNTEALFELAEILGRQSDFSEILRVVSAKTSTIFNANLASILMVNPQSRDTYKTIMKKEIKIKKEQFSVVQSIIIGWVMVNKSPILITDLKNDNRFNQDIIKDIPIQTAMCVPLYYSDLRIGYIVVMNKYGKKLFNKDDLKFLERIAVISAPYLSNIQKIKEYFSVPLPESILVNKYRLVGLLGKSKKFIELLRSIEAASKCDVRVILEGQTGTGKELIAKAIHHYSNRNHKKFIAIDCGAIPANLIESELFGHIKGAFTGANISRKGLMEEANGGTLFMDEINNLPLEMQAKLLRVLQEGEIRPIGSNEIRKVDVRIITASSVSLKQIVEQQKFREDLFYRLYVYPISVPSLKERREDIPLLADFFLNKFASKQQKQAELFHEELLEFFINHSWSGNIRELANLVERLVTLAPSEITVIDACILPEEFRQEWQKAETISPRYNTTDSLERNLSDYETKLIRKVLIECNWNQSKAARQLKISERSIRYKMNKLGISR